MVFGIVGFAILVAIAFYWPKERSKTPASSLGE